MKKNKVLRKLAIIAVIFVFMMLFTGCEPRQETVVVDKTSWEYIVNIEKEVLCQESAWSLPEEAVLLEERQEVFKEEFDDEGNVIGQEYRTRYYYEILRWKYERKVVTNGSGFFQYFGDYTLAEDERVGSQEKNYYIHGKNQEGKNVKYEVPRREWNDINEGDTLELEISFFGGVEIKSHRKALT